MMGAPRSVMYVPASRRDFLAKIPSLEADFVLVDLEDGVAPSAKEEARDNVRAAVAAGHLAGHRPWMLRVNAGRLGPPPEDLMLVGFAKPPVVVLPKAEDPDFVRALAGRFAEHNAATALMIETAAGVTCATPLLAAHPAVCMVIVGSEDLRLSLRARPDPDRAWERYALSAILVAARRCGRVAIDSAYLKYRDRRGLERHAAVARDLGFDGKSCIHPSQISVVHEVYTSTEEEVDWARRVLTAWAEGNGVAKGIVAMDGEMVEALHVSVAEQILGRA